MQPFASRISPIPSGESPICARAPMISTTLPKAISIPSTRTRGCRSRSTTIAASATISGFVLASTAPVLLAIDCSAMAESPR